MAEDQNKDRQEEQMVGGPVSAGASNKDAPYRQDKQSTDDSARQTNSDYEPMVGNTASGVGENASSNRDLGTVGGGNVPGVSGSRGGVGASDSTVESGGAPAGGTIGGGATTDRGSGKDSDVGTSPVATNSVAKQSQGSGQAGLPRGDQDATQGRPGEEITDPMSSRAPDKINQNQEQDQQ